LIKTKKNNQKGAYDMRAITTLSLDEADTIIRKLITSVKCDSGDPVAIVVAGADGEWISCKAMDGVKPASKQVAMNKAYTAVMLGTDTLEYYARCKNDPSFDGRNFGDSRITLFPGAVILTWKDKIIGAIGVSGRKGHRTSADKIAQDHELADKARKQFYEETAGIQQDR